MFHTFIVCTITRNGLYLLGSIIVAPTIYCRRELWTNPGCYLNVPRPELRIKGGWQTGMHELVSCAHFVVQLAVGEEMMNPNNKPIGRMQHFHQYRVLGGLDRGFWGRENEGACVIVVPRDWKMMTAERRGSRTGRMYSAPEVCGARAPSTDRVPLT